MADQRAQLDPTELSKSPSMEPPPGVTIDFDEPNPLEATLITVTSVFVGLAFLFAGIRAYTKIKIYRRGSWDDLTCALGLISTLAYWITTLLQVLNEGFGHHFWNVPLIVSLSDAFNKLAFVSDWIFNIAYIFIKLTFFILYWNIFKPFRWLKLSIIGGALVVTSAYTAMTLASLIRAAPRAGQTWLETNTIPTRLTVPMGAFGLVSDVFILLLPISGVLRLQLSPKRKFALLMAFMTGTGACVCSSLGIYYRTLLDRDVTYSVVRIETVTIVELCVGICLTCMPATSVFLRHVLPPVDSLRSKFISYSSKLRGSLPLRQRNAFHGTDSHQNRTAGTDGPYRNLKDRGLAVNDNGVYDLAPHPANTVKTNVVAGPFGDLSDDRIHLRVDLEQG